jgi:formylglycine-generating enzyme required for sulfatase activity
MRITLPGRWAIGLVLGTIVWIGCSESSNQSPDSGSAGAGGVGGQNSDMVTVPAGPFMMGCNSPIDQNCNPDESPYHSADLSGFAIDTTEVTQEAYAACAQAGACLVIQGMPADQVPVHDVTWTTASAYCAWVGKRLPTEAEWEKAARGTDGRVYPWGNTPPACAEANFGTCAGMLLPVGGRPAGASPYGALDMAGNVAEWVANRYAADYYASSPTTDPQGPISGTDYVDRGGWYRSSAAQIRTSFREANPPATGLSYMGFRCVR